MVFNFSIVIILIYSTAGFSSWTPHDQKLYSSRHFIELSHLLVMQNKTELLKKMQLQENDLAGCRSLNRGYGGIEAMVLCMRFLNRENELKLFTSGRKKLASDINILCSNLLPKPGGLQSLLDGKVFTDKYGHAIGEWQQCNAFAWRQVYLTVYANFDADPIGALAFAHKAQGKLAPHSFWSGKTFRIFNQSSQKD